MNDDPAEPALLNVLSLEDSIFDYEIIKEKLLSTGYKLNISRVDDENGFVSLIRSNRYDIILADYNLPGFDAFHALIHCNQLAPDVPFICVSGSIGEITAIELLKHGAVDYVLKDRLERLPSAVNRALKEAKEKKARKDAEKALQESEERLRDIIFSSADWVWEVDENGQYTYSSQKGLKLFDYSHEEIIGKTPFDFMPEDEAQRVGAIFSEIVGAKAPIKDLENWNITKDGKRICLLTNGVPMLDSEGRLKGYRGVDKDITERKLAVQELIKAKEKAEASDKLKTAFMNNVSHEIRTPLNGILGFGQILTDESLSPEERSRYLAMLNKSSDRLINTVTNFMDISLINSGNQEVFKTEFNLSNLIKNVVGKFEEDCREKNLPILIQASPAMHETNITTDGELLSKTIYQLLDNAVKFTIRGEITIGYKIIENNLHLYVKDTGIGISEEKIYQIFDKFIQENVSNTRGYEGSGIGLSIAKGFAQLLGGDICLESEKGKGSTFYLFIPCMEKTITREQQNRLQHPGVKKRNHTILVTEDDEINFFYLEILLKQASVNILHATTGLEAVEMSKDHPEICLVLMDLKLPDMDGFEATRQIKQSRPTLPVLAITAYSGTEEKQKALQAGCDDFLTKPINKEFLFKKLEEFCLITFNPPTRTKSV